MFGSIAVQLKNYQYQVRTLPNHSVVPNKKKIDQIIKMFVSETKKLFEQFIDLQVVKNERYRRDLRVISPICGSILTLLFCASIVLNMVFGDRSDFNKEPVSFCVAVVYPTIPLIHWHIFNNYYNRFLVILDEMEGIARKCK